MAVPEGRSIYEALGTVLYCTIPVNVDDADDANPLRKQQRQQKQWCDAEIPLDYDAALALREIDEATMAARYMATKTRGAASATAGCAASRDGINVADRVSSATTVRASVAAPVAGPVPPQRSGMVSPLSARYGAASSSGGPPSALKAGQHVRTGGSISSNTSAAVFRSGAEVGGGQWEVSDTVDIPAKNARFVKTRMRAAAAAAAKTGSGTIAAGAPSRSARGASVSDTLTVAQAMEILFPIEAVCGGNGGRDDSAKDSEAEAADGAPTSQISASPLEALGAAADTTAAAAPRAPVMWRRADVAHLSRLDVVLLYQHLQRRCATESARPRGVVCPNRERIYNDGLRELIRQVTLLCPERGLLLDELARSMRQSIETYDVLLDSASQYAVRKSTERDLHQHLFAEKAALETEVRRREHRVSEWRAKYAGLQKRFQEQQAADSKLHAEEIAYAKRANQQLISEIKRLASEAEKAKAA
ncbi:hypothetical protein LSCM4_05095 [Leishmania orientalis]|uniref:Dynein arm light chain, axonemal n=1 Tax=Leishmania orientalis TaxID=2249476 RepID=A0A836KKC5_9TRYP|nr:hypothetical protein LSCM4_05095 [Leishmania orientalis]